MSIQRPSSKDTDEDLLLMQKEFLSSKSVPSASYVKPKEERVSDSHDLNESSSFSKKEGNIEDVNTAVLFQILDRKIDRSSMYKPPTIRHNVDAASGFPRTFKRSIEAQGNANIRKQKKSIFSREMSKRREIDVNNPTNLESLPNHSTVVSEFPSSKAKTVIDGSGLSPANPLNEVNKINLENEAKLATMSLEEISSYQNELFKQLDEKTIAFLKSHRKERSELSATEVPTEMMEVQTEKTVTETPKPDTISASKPVSTLKTDTQDTNELPIPLKDVEKNKWVNMNKVEWNKLAWTKNLPEPKPFDRKSGQSARFDLEGNLMTGITNVPVHLGLHHHGVDGELPGYTFEELFQLARSRLPPQRCLALKTISGVLSRNSCGLFDDVLASPLVIQLIDSGIVLLLRCALDDEQISVVSTAIHALHSLLFIRADEVCLDETFTWSGGCVTPLMYPSDSPITRENLAEKLTDEQIMDSDIVFALVRMDLLPRLRYILEVLEPEALDVICIMEILMRLARHSTELALQIMECPRLISFINIAFLPLHWTPPETVTGKLYRVHGIPLHSALKLIRILASTDRNLAHKLCSEYNIPSRLCCYISSNPDSQLLPLSEMLKLCIESCYTWKIFLYYELATEMFTDLLPVWLRTLRFCYSLNASDSLHIGDLHYASAVLNSLEGVVTVSSLDVPSFEAIFQMVVEANLKWINELSKDPLLNFSAGFTCLGSALSFITSYVLHSSKNNTDTSAFETALEKLLFVLEMFLKCDVFVTGMMQMREFSSLLKLDGKRRYPPSLCSLEAVKWGGDNIEACLHKGSKLPALLAVSWAILNCCELRYLPCWHGLKDIVKEKVNRIAVSFCNGLKTYLKCITENPPLSLQTDVTWFSKFEIELIINTVLITEFQSASANSEELSLYHELSICSVGLALQFQDLQKRVSRLLAVIFNSQFNVASKEKQMLTPEVKLLSENLENHFPSKEKLSNLHYNFDRLFKQLNKSSADIPASLIPSCNSSVKSEWKNVANWKREWICLPLLEPLLVDKRQNSAVVYQFLLWLQFLLENRNAKLITQPNLLFCRIASIYLLEDELFLDKDVNQMLGTVLSTIMKLFPHPSLDKEDLEFSFQDFYRELLNQFESVSYGDPVFAAAILVPLQGVYPSEWRKMFLSEHQNILPWLKIDITESLVPVENYLTPIEKDDEVIELYFKLVLQGNQLRSGLLYAIAIHHLHHRVFATDAGTLNTKLKAIFKAVIQLRNDKIFCMDILRYKGINIDEPRGLLLNPEIPPAVFDS